MMFLKPENNIEPKENFYLEIEEYYDGVSNNRIPEDLLTEIVEEIRNNIYSDYTRFWEQFPKSRKRYSKLKLEDLNHPFVHFLITDLLKRKNLSQYREFSKTLFAMTDAELDEYEKAKFLYETK